MRRIGKTEQEQGNLTRLFENGGRFESITKFVKENPDVFLGVRDNKIDLYVNGGGRFLGFDVKESGGKAGINQKYLGDSKVQKLNIDEAIRKEKLSELKESVENYEKNTLEKKFKQKLIQVINTNSDFYAYDIEYRFDPISKELKGKIKTAGQPDLILMSRPNEKNEVDIYLMEVKYGKDSFAGANEKTMGSGIVGHIGKTIELLKLSRENCQVREHFENEVKGIMKFYQDLGLIENKNFKNIDFSKIKVINIQYGFIFGGWNDSVEKSFKNYLGISKGKGNAKYSVKNLLDKKVQTEYSYITRKDMIDFKYVTYTDTEEIKFDLNNQYKTIALKIFE